MVSNNPPPLRAPSQLMKNDGACHGLWSVDVEQIMTVNSPVIIRSLFSCICVVIFGVDVLSLDRHTGALERPNKAEFSISLLAKYRLSVLSFALF